MNSLAGPSGGSGREVTGPRIITGMMIIFLLGSCPLVKVADIIIIVKPLCEAIFVPALERSVFASSRAASILREEVILQKGLKRLAIDYRSVNLRMVAILLPSIKLLQRKS
jgi:hypothetical protein